MSMYDHIPHPRLELGNSIVMGGDARKVIKNKYDTVIGLDTRCRYSEGWLFHINNYSIPYDLEDFDFFMERLYIETQYNKKIFIGCFSGHGRTGLVLSCLLSRYYPGMNSLKLLREIYCPLAVETKTQQDFICQFVKANEEK